jgi:hypothetical protein
MGHQGCAREPKRHAQFGILELNFESNSGVQYYIAFKLMPKMHTTSDLDVLHIHEKLRR